MTAASGKRRMGAAALQQQQRACRCLPADAKRAHGGVPQFCARCAYTTSRYYGSANKNLSLVYGSAKNLSLVYS